jgi:hypothetical protein
MQSMTRNLCLALALSLAATAATAQEAAPTMPAPAAASMPAAAQPVEELEELAEIQVKGKRLLQEIAEAEDAFYKVFNQVNKDDDYDTNCADLRLESGSRITTRACIPGFVADAIVDWQVFKAQCSPPYDGYDEFSCLDRNKDNRISQNEATARPGLDVQFMTLDSDHNSFLVRQEIEDAGGIPAGTVTYQPPPPQLVLMEGSTKWAQAMKKVIDSDPRLQQMAGGLDDLYAELSRVNQKFVKVQADGMPEATTRRELGPRAR